MNARWAGAAALLLAVGGARAAEAPGKAVFNRHCQECHAAGDGYPGTQRLAVLRGKAASALEARKDLTPEYVRLIVRRGLFEMPPLRPSELPDAELAVLADYLGNGRR
jgi:(+)-pinoresinol hydroxylase